MRRGTGTWQGTVRRRSSRGRDPIDRVGLPGTSPGTTAPAAEGVGAHAGVCGEAPSHRSSRVCGRCLSRVCLSLHAARVSTHSPASVVRVYAEGLEMVGALVRDRLGAGNAEYARVEEDGQDALNRPGSVPTHTRAPSLRTTSHVVSIDSRSPMVALWRFMAAGCGLIHPYHRGCQPGQKGWRFSDVLPTSGISVAYA